MHSCHFFLFRNCSKWRNQSISCLKFKFGMNNLFLPIVWLFYQSFDVLIFCWYIFFIQKLTIYHLGMLLHIGIIRWYQFDFCTSKIKTNLQTIVNLWTWIAFSVSEDPCKTKIETIWLDVGMLRGEIVLNQMILTCFISTIFIFNVNNSKRQSIFY